MRLIGWCSSCRRIRPVDVATPGLTKAIAGKAITVGTCSTCDEATKTERRRRDQERRDSRHRRWGGNP